MWIAVTFAAAIAQTLRTAAQQRLRSLLSVNGAGFVRYAYGAPVAIGAVAAMAAAGVDLPVPPGRFWPLVLGAGCAQILATNALIHAFDLRNFAVGTVYAKTEVVQVGLFSAVLLGEPLSPAGWAGAVVVLAGIAVLALGGTPTAGPGWRALTGDRAAAAGLAAGALFGLAAIGIRAASTSLGDGPAVVRALVTLAVMNTAQTLLQGGFLAVRQRDQLRLAVRHWRSSAVVGLLSVLGSGCWAVAFTLQNAARVRTVGQVELVVTFAVSRWWLHERQRPRDLGAAALVMAGVVVVVLAG